MPQIFYYTNSVGTLVAKWPGRSVRTVEGNRKEGQFYLGRVVNKAEHVFYKSKLGYYRFDPETLECLPIPEDEVPPYDGPVDDREREPATFVFFGGVYLIDRLIRGIGYREVLEAIPFADRDTLMTMIHYYALENKTVSLAELWYKANYASFLYPHADVTCRRVSDMLASIGTEDARASFLKAHAAYLTEVTDEKHCALVVRSIHTDGRGAQPATDARLITVAQRSSDLPVWYELIPAGVSEADAIENVTYKLHIFGYEVDCVLSDACQCYAEDVERLALFDAILDFDRMPPTSERTMEAIEGHLLLSFVTTFLRTVVKNRMGSADAHYVAPPRALCGRLTEADGKPIVVELPDGMTLTVIEQDLTAETPLCPPDAALYAVGLWPAKVSGSEIVPAKPTPEALGTYSAFGIRQPVIIVHESHTLTPFIRDGETDRCTRARVFATRPAITDEEIEAQRARAKVLKQETARALVDVNPEPDATASVQEAAPKPAKRRGRPKGSKNKRTLEREAEEQRLAELGLLPPKRGRGRPKGSKNKKTLEREAAERARLETSENGSDTPSDAGTHGLS